MQKTRVHVLYSAFFIAAVLPPVTARAEQDTAPSGAPASDSTGAPASTPVAETATPTPPPAPAAMPPEPMPAPAPMPELVATPAPTPPSPPATTAAATVKSTVASKFSADLYGFVEFDSIHDSTQSFVDLAGNGAIARDSWAANHQRTIFGARNSRLGLKMKGPETEDLKTSAIMEMDFFGNQPPTGISEAAFFVNPTFRIRHFALKLETPFVDIMFGQYWQLFGWQSLYHPNTVEIQGVPGQIYSRSPQIRISRMIKTDELSIELALAAVRPAQRDSSMPDGQAGLRLILNNWKGLHTAGATGTAIDGASIGVSGVVRRFELPEFAAKPVDSKVKYGSGVSVDALIPVIPATPDSKGNSLSLIGSFVDGTSIADLYTGLSGGISMPTSVPSTTGSPATYTPNVDNGLVAFDTITGDLHTINWMSFMAGFQYYLPPSGNVWIAGNLSWMKSSNIGSFADLYATAAKVFDHSLWADGNLFVDLNQAVRLGAEFAYFRQTYVDGQKEHNYRGQFSAFYIF